MHAQHTAAPQHRRCSRCQATKPPGDFYRNPASICKACHNAASRLAGEVRRAALARLVQVHWAEYRRLLDAERARRALLLNRSTPSDVQAPLKPELVEDLGGEAA
jgi:recombinational DNA repair protein (RecF pathway)